MINKYDMIMNMMMMMGRFCTGINSQPGRNNILMFIHKEWGTNIQSRSFINHFVMECQ